MYGSHRAGSASPGQGAGAGRARPRQRVAQSGGRLRDRPRRGDDRRGLPRGAGRPARGARCAGRRRPAGQRPGRCRRVRDPGAVRAHRQAASLRRRARRGGRGPSCVRSGRSVRESLRQGPGDPQRRRNRGRGRRRRRGAGRAAPEPGVSEARSDGSAARDPQVRGHARRAYGDRVRRLALDLRPGQPRARAPVACRGRRDRDRNRNGAVRRPAADGARSRPAGESPAASRRVRFAPLASR